MISFAKLAKQAGIPYHSIMTKTTLLFISGLLLSSGALADIYKSVDEHGRVTYTNIPMRGAKKTRLEPLSTIPATKPRPSAATPPNFPAVDSKTQKERDQTRREILQNELASEEKQLAEARKALTEGQENPEVFTAVVNGKAVTRRNVAKYEQKIKTLQDDVTRHEKNVAALKTELTGLK